MISRQNFHNKRVAKENVPFYFRNNINQQEKMGTKTGPTPTVPATEWENKPIYFCAHPDSPATDYKPGQELPLAKPVKIESELFVGQVFCRLKPINLDKGHSDYFQGRKRHYQFIVQGRFKQPQNKTLTLADIVVGDFYEAPLNGVPKGYLMKMYEKFMQSITPGMIMEMSSDKPKILTSVGSAQTMRVDKVGEEPDISAGVPVIENTALLFENSPYQPKMKMPYQSSAIAKRKKYLTKPKNAIKHKINPDHVYTIEFYDHTMCFAKYEHHVLGMTVDMVKSMNGQPLAMAMFTRDDKEIIYKLNFWHENLLMEMKQ